MIVFLLTTVLRLSQSDLRVPQYKTNSVLIPDNEPRNKQIVTQLERAIDEDIEGSLADYVRQKDINDMILSGMDAVEIMDIIHTNTVSGLSAKVALQEWKKI